jgi:hypothetical protein
MVTQDILIIIIIVIAIEAITEIIVDSDFPLLKWLKRKIADKAFETPQTNKILVVIHNLLGCGYCTSVWVSGFISIWTPLYNYFNNPIICWIISTFAFHRLSNWVHIFYELVKRGRVSTHDVNLTIGDDDGSP